MHLEDGEGVKRQLHSTEVEVQEEQNILETLGMDHNVYDVLMTTNILSMHLPRLQ